jgi:hypothetical protein
MNRLLLPPAFENNTAMQAEPPKANPPKRKCRWFQFSLRSSLIFTLMSAVGSVSIFHPTGEVFQ